MDYLIAYAINTFVVVGMISVIVLIVELVKRLKH